MTDRFTWEPGDLEVIEEEALIEFHVGQDLEDIKAEYQVLLEEVMLDYITEPEGRPITAFRNAFRRAVNDAFTTTFYTGWGDAGMGAEVPDEAVDWLVMKIETEVGYADSLWEDLKQMRKELPPSEIEPWVTARAEGYTHTLDGIYDEAKVRGALELPLTFGGTDGEETCDTCQGLKGQTHPARWWVENNMIPGQSGNENYDCLGYKCQHVLLDPKGNVFSAEMAYEVLKELWYRVLFEGGPTSGNWGHEGVPGQHGGSSSGGGHDAVGASSTPTRSELVSKSEAQREEKPEWKQGTKRVIPKGLSREEKKEFLYKNIPLEVRSKGSAQKIKGENAEIREKIAEMAVDNPDEALQVLLRDARVIVCTDEKAFVRLYGSERLEEKEGKVCAYYKRGYPKDELVLSPRGTNRFVFAHELGHSVHFASPEGKAWTEEYERNPHFDRNTLYSRTNDREGFAETYEAWVTSGMPSEAEAFEHWRGNVVRAFTYVARAVAAAGGK